MLTFVSNFPLAARAAESAREYYPLVLDRQAASGGQISELLDAVTIERDAVVGAISTQFQYFASTARLAHAMGISPRENGRTPGEEIATRLSGL